jgi:superfamily II DNA or RNA helicase
MELRQYQKDISKQASEILEGKKIVYLSMEVRTGKTLTALNAAELYGAKNVLFLTKKRAIKSIEDDYKNFGFSFDLMAINNESAHKFIGKYDLIISSALSCKSRSKLSFKL